jgi:hypothetical protein
VASARFSWPLACLSSSIRTSSGRPVWSLL